MRPLLLMLSFLIAFGLPAQKKPVATVSTPSFDQSLYSGIRSRELGPFRGVRSSTVTGVPGSPNLYYFGAGGGGVWRTKDAGQTWSNLTDAYFGGTIGCNEFERPDNWIIQTSKLASSM